MQKLVLASSSRLKLQMGALRDLIDSVEALLKRSDYTFDKNSANTKWQKEQLEGCSYQLNHVVINSPSLTSSELKDARALQDETAALIKRLSK